MTADSHPVTVWGQYPEDGDKKLSLPSLYGFSALRLSLLGDSRTVKTGQARLAASSCTYNGGTKDKGADLSPQKSGMQTGDYRIYLLVANYQPADPASAAKGQALRPGTMSLKDRFVSIF